MITSIHPSNKIYIKFIDNTKGWGVFAKEPILKNEIVEQCYGVVDNYSTSPLKDYVFSLTPDSINTDVIHLFGFGPVYNHSNTPNIIWKFIDKNVVEFTSIADINIDDEICFNYGDNYLEIFKTKFI